MLTAGAASADTTPSTQSFTEAGVSPKVADPKPINNAAVVTVKLGWPAGARRQP